MARGEDPGPLAGVPFGVKDLEDCAGLPTSHGSLLFKDAPAGRGGLGAGGPHAGRRRGAARQDRGSRVRHAQLHQDEGVGDHPQPVGPGAHARAARAVARRPRSAPGSCRSRPRATAVGRPASRRASPAWSGSRPATGASRTSAPSGSQTAVNGVLDDDRRRRRPPPRRGGRAGSAGPHVAAGARRLLRAGHRGARHGRASGPAGRSTSGSPPSTRRSRELTAAAASRAGGRRRPRPGRRAGRADRSGPHVALERRARPVAGRRGGSVAVDRRRPHPLLPLGARADARPHRAEHREGRCATGPGWSGRWATCSARSSVLITPTTAVPAFAAEGPPPSEIAGTPVGPAMATPFTMLGNLCWNPSVSVPVGRHQRGPAGRADGHGRPCTATTSPCAWPACGSRPAPGPAGPRAHPEGPAPPGIRGAMSFSIGCGSGGPTSGRRGRARPSGGGAVPRSRRSGRPARPARSGSGLAAHRQDACVAGRDGAEGSCGRTARPARAPTTATSASAIGSPGSVNRRAAWCWSTRCDLLERGRHGRPSSRRSNGVVIAERRVGHHRERPAGERHPQRVAGDHPGARFGRVALARAPRRGRDRPRPRRTWAPAGQQRVADRASTGPDVEDEIAGPDRRRRRPGGRPRRRRSGHADRAPVGASPVRRRARRTITAMVDPIGRDATTAVGRAAQLISGVALVAQEALDLGDEVRRVDLRPPASPRGAGRRPRCRRRPRPAR